jgi:GH25 family lysozyme M1 (1,4-beta-N-acetylmuramidase)
MKEYKFMDVPDIDPITLRPQEPEGFSVRGFITGLLSTTTCSTVPKSEMASGGDVSKWQGEMDWNKFFDEGMQFAVIRAMINGYPDEQFERNAQILTDQKRPFLVYGATGYPTLSNAIPYARALADIIKGYPYLGVWWDAEASGLLNPHEMAIFTSDLLGELRALLPEAILEIYTRQTFWDSSVEAGNWSKYPLAAARYNESLTCPWSDGRYRFRDWQTWRYWQDSQWYDGRKYGAQSTYIDHDYFNGTFEDFKVTYNYGVELPPTNPEIIERIEKLETEMIEVQTQLTKVEEELETHEHEVIEKDTLTVAIIEQHMPHYYRDTDKACEPDAGKPIMETDNNMSPLKVDQQFECNKELYLHCKDDPTTPTTMATGGRLFYRIAEGGYAGRFIRADKSQPRN